MAKNTDLDFGRILASAVEAAMGEDGQHDEPQRRERGGGSHTMRRVATGIAVAAVARVAVSKGPKLMTKAAPKLLNLPNFSDVSDRVSGMTDRVRDNLTDRGWLGDEEDGYEDDDELVDEEEDLPEDEEEDEPEAEEEDLPEDEFDEDEEPEDEEDDLPEDEFDEDEEPEDEEEDLPE